MGEPGKPNGMHWTTYNRLLDQADDLDDMGWGYVMGGLLGRLGYRTRLLLRQPSPPPDGTRDRKIFVIFFQPSDAQNRVYGETLHPKRFRGVGVAK
jgi:hypothetical protein